MIPPDDFAQVYESIYLADAKRREQVEIARRSEVLDGSMWTRPMREPRPGVELGTITIWKPRALGPSVQLRFDF